MRYPDARCVLYDDEHCLGQEGKKELQDMNIVKNVTRSLNITVESVSIKKGCQLTIHTGTIIVHILTRLSLVIFHYDRG